MLLHSGLLNLLSKEDNINLALVCKNPFWKIISKHISSTCWFKYELFNLFITLINFI